MKVSLVRAADRCPGELMPVPNTTTSDGLPACTPPPLLSSYQFDDAGKCDLTILHKSASGEACTTATECSEMTFAAKCTGIESASATPIDGESGWRLAIMMRLVPDDRANGDMTLIELPYEYEFPPATDGKLELKLKSTTLDMTYLRPLYVAGDPFFEKCMSLQLAPRGSREPADDFGSYFPRDPSVRILDPAGNVFAAFGTGVAADASAGCGINLGAAARGIKGSLVRATSSCPFSSVSSPNSTTAYGLPTCAPPFPLSLSSVRRYDERKGACKIALRQRATACTDMPSETCAPLSVNLRCNGIVTGGPSEAPTPLDETGWTLSMIVRATMSDGTAEGVTVINFPAYVDLPPVTNGKLKLKTVLYELAMAGSPPNVLGLPGCTSLEVVEVALHDPVGNKFARLGTAVFPKN